ncbi:hypothetical protein L3Y34_002937 [Caenorhabditis briggsae]|uniref:Uncharacterized protein n=1 Tax=Caenorhabditis briggsae TaxID=6238 RepID=A0AAE9A7J5_CAEBR|nr:hypothetical protein L3Y34_002937 [Caenorhabditis briggsae]
MSIYLIIVWALIEAQNKKIDELNSPFFKLCLSTAGVDIWTLLTNYLGAMFPKWGWFPTVYLFLGNPYGKIYLYFAWCTGVCQAMGVSVLASNRLSVMLFPTSFHKMPPTTMVIRSRTKERAKMRETRLFTMSTIIVGVQLCILTLFIFKGADILAFTTDQFYLVYNAVSFQTLAVPDVPLEETPKENSYKRREGKSSNRGGY